jgi:hypothetical protein
LLEFKIVALNPPAMPLRRRGQFRLIDHALE